MRLAGGVVALAIGVGVVAGALQPVPVGFRPLGLTDLVQLVTPLVLLALFIERVLEVVLTAWRGPGARRQLDAARLSAYKAQTQRIAFIAATALGVTIGFAGVRMLQPLLDPAPLAGGAVPSWQRGMIVVVDVLFTGTVLSGGSAGVHRVLKALTDFMATVKATPASG